MLYSFRDENRLIASLYYLLTVTRPVTQVRSQNVHPFPSESTNPVVKSLCTTRALRATRAVVVRVHLARHVVELVLVREDLAPAFSIRQ